MSKAFRRHVTEVPPAIVSESTFTTNPLDIVCHAHTPLRARRGRRNGPQLIFTHSRGSGLENVAICSLLAGYSSKLETLTFEGTDNERDRIDRFRYLVREHGHENLAIGGRSFGARISVPVALETGVKKLIFFSFPLHKDMDIRSRDLLALSAETDVLFITGNKDEFCSKIILEEVRSQMNARSYLIYIVGGDHAMWRTAADGGEVARSALNLEAGRLAAEWQRKRPESTEGQLQWNRENGQVVWSGWRQTANSAVQIPSLVATVAGKITNVNSTMLGRDSDYRIQFSFLMGSLWFTLAFVVCLSIFRLVVQDVNITVNMQK